MCVRVYVCMYVCMCSCLCMYVYTYVCMYVCMHACMHVCMYVHTYYVLTNPPIPSSHCKCFVVLRLVKILLRERGRPRVPPCNVLKMSFLFFFKAVTLYFCVLFKFWFARAGTPGPPLVNPLNNVFFYL